MHPLKCLFIGGGGEPFLEVSLETPPWLPLAKTREAWHCPGSGESLDFTVGGGQLPQEVERDGCLGGKYVCHPWTPIPNPSLFNPMVPPQGCQTLR